MRAMAPKLLGIPLSCDADHKAKASGRPGLHSRERILDDDRACRFNAEQLCRHQKRIGGRFPAQLPGMDYVAVDLYNEEVIQLNGPQNGRTVLTRSDDSDFEPATAELTDEFDASLVRHHPCIFNDLVDQLVLAVPEPA